MEPAHITSQFLMPLGMGKKNIAITIHDLNQIHKTGIDFISTGFMDIKLSLLNRYQKITVVSNFVKQDVLNHFRVDENLIQVLYNWIDLSKIMVQDLSTKRKDSEIITLIHVGNDQPNKNINLIYRLLNYLPATYYLIRVGSNSKRNLRYVEKNGLRKRIKFYQGISKEKLGELYNFADIFIYPSTNEGFGRPLLEAMAHGLPIIYRNSSSLPEIAGSAGLSFESDDLEEISEKIKMVAEYKNYRLLAQKSLERSKFFDISNQKSKILRFYRELLDWT
jgi:glycosyltransferase involved in cell wall biosynthesis